MNHPPNFTISSESLAIATQWKAITCVWKKSKNSSAINANFYLEHQIRFDNKPITVGVWKKESKMERETERKITISYFNTISQLGESGDLTVHVEALKGPRPLDWGEMKRLGLRYSLRSTESCLVGICENEYRIEQCFLSECKGSITHYHWSHKASSQQNSSTNLPALCHTHSLTLSLKPWAEQGQIKVCLQGTNQNQRVLIHHRKSELGASNPFTLRDATKSTRKISTLEINVIFSRTPVPDNVHLRVLWLIIINLLTFINYYY